MSQRYKFQELNLLQKTSHQHFYSSKREHVIMKDRQYCQKDSSAPYNSSFKKYRVKSTGNPTKKEGSELTVRYLKEKLDQFMNQSNSPGANFAKRNQLQSENRVKRADSFRITAFRKSIFRNNLLKGTETPKELNYQDIQNEFKVKEAVIQRRTSLSDIKQYDRMGFLRNFLKFHGENKCFERAVFFKKNRKEGEKGDKLIQLLEKQRYNVDDQNSLQYSSEQFEANDGVQGWKKSNDKMEWSGFSNFEN